MTATVTLSDGTLWNLKTTRKGSFINGWTKESVEKHILDNFKGVSRGSFGGCLYRASYGKKCAVGLFIPDDEYSPRMEGRTAETLLKSWDVDLLRFMPLNIEDMRGWQIVHDNLPTDLNLEDAMKVMLAFLELSPEVSELLAS